MFFSINKICEGEILNLQKYFIFQNENFKTNLLFKKCVLELG
jgi:hypothetical protein